MKELLAGGTAGSWVVGYPHRSADEGHPGKEDPGEREAVVVRVVDVARGGQRDGRGDGGEAHRGQRSRDSAVGLRLLSSRNHHDRRRCRHAVVVCILNWCLLRGLLMGFRSTSYVKRICLIPVGVNYQL